MPAQTPHRFLTRPSLLSVAIAGLLLAPVARGATITVDSLADPSESGKCTLRHAIENINSGSNLNTDCVANESPHSYDDSDRINIVIPSLVTGTITLNGTELAITKSVAIVGPGADNLAVDGDHQSRVFKITGASRVGIEGLTIQNGSVSEDGGGIYLTKDCSLALTNSTVSGNTAEYSGGGIAAYFRGAYDPTSMNVTLTNSTVSGNTAVLYYGGGIAMMWYSSLTLTNSTVSGNSAGYDGGGIYSGCVGNPDCLNSVTLNNSTVSNNSAYYNGGGIKATVYVAVTLTNSTVSGNTAGKYYSGGGIYADFYSSVTLTNSTVSGNSAGFGAGGISIDMGGLTLTDSTVSGNSAGYSGGGIYASRSMGDYIGRAGQDWHLFVTLTNSTVSGNTAGLYSGGGILLSKSTATLTNSTVSGNSAGYSGGGVYIWGGGAQLRAFPLSVDPSKVTLTNSTVSSNTAGYFGGGVYARSRIATDDLSPTLTDVTLTDLTLTNSTLSGNSAGETGGGIFAYAYARAKGGKSLTLTNVTLTNVTLTNSTLSGNSAGTNGGGINANAKLLNSVTLTNSTLTNLTLSNSIVANSTSGDCEKSDLSTVTGSYTLIEDGSNACGLTNGTNHNIIGSDPLLGPLADNGCLTKAGNLNAPAPYNDAPYYGCVQTQALQPGSPALNSANNTVCTSDPVNSRDERGAVRPQPAAAICDMGAFEQDLPAPTSVTATPGPGQVKVTWTPPDPGLGGALTSCTATADPGGAYCAAPAGTNQCTITGLTPGTSYTFTVSCTSGTGPSAITGFASAPSGPVIPTEPVNGACGAAGGQTFTSPPSENLCTTGTAGNVTPGNTNYTWSCTGSNGGTDASCSATRNYVVSTSFTGSGTITPASQNAAYNAIKTFTVTPAEGYAVASARGCGGALSGSIYTTGPITSACTINVTFTQPTPIPTLSVWGLFGTAGLLGYFGAWRQRRWGQRRRA